MQPVFSTQWFCDSTTREFLTTAAYRKYFPERTKQAIWTVDVFLNSLGHLVPEIIDCFLQCSLIIVMADYKGYLHWFNHSCWYLKQMWSYPLINGWIYM